jgi:signal transduction histidine kinase
MRRPLSVRTQLLVLELGIALPLLGLIALLFLEFQSDEASQARASTARVGRSIADNIERFVLSQDVVLENLSRRPLVQAADPNRCDPVFSDFLVVRPRATDLLLVGPRGVPVCVADPRSSPMLAPELHDALEQAWRSEGAVMSRAYLDGSSRWTIARARPVEREGRMVAVLAMVLDIPQVLSAISGAELPRGATVEILDARGFPIAGLGLGTHRASASSRDRGWTSRVPLRQLGWTVVSRVPRAVAVGEHTERVVQLGTLCVLLLTLATALALYVSAEIARPIQALSAATRQAARGHLDVRVPLDGCAEAAEVARGFNSLLASRATVEDRLRRAEHMSAMGALVAGVAHEVRNPLFGITATVDAFEARAGADGPYATYLGVLREQASRLARLMSDLLEYGRPHGPRPEAVEPARPLEEARHQCSGLARTRGVRIVSRVSSHEAIAIDLERVTRALRNLIENAVQFSPSGRTVTTEAHERSDAGGSFLVYRVIDGGPGFAEADLERALEPFFSRRRGGTGLGLSIARRIAEEHGGRLLLGNHARGGGVVTLELPLAVAMQAVS